MKNPILVATLLTSLLGSSAYANTFVQCGKSANIKTNEIKDFELALSSEGADDYSGPVGKKWNLKLGSEDSDWLKPNKNVIAKSYESENNTIVEITIKTGQSVTGGVGTKYKLTGLFDETPKLEKFTFGGFAGTVKIGTFQCLSAND